MNYYNNNTVDPFWFDPYPAGTPKEAMLTPLELAMRQQAEANKKVEELQQASRGKSDGRIEIPFDTNQPNYPPPKDKMRSSHFVKNPDGIGLMNPNWTETQAWMAKMHLRLGGKTVMKRSEYFEFLQLRRMEYVDNPQVKSSYARAIADWNIQTGLMRGLEPFEDIAEFIELAPTEVVINTLGELSQIISNGNNDRLEALEDALEVRRKKYGDLNAAKQQLDNELRNSNRQISKLKNEFDKELKDVVMRHNRVEQGLKADVAIWEKKYQEVLEQLGDSTNQINNLLTVNENIRRDNEELTNLAKSFDKEGNTDPEAFINRVREGMDVTGVQEDMIMALLNGKKEAIAERDKAKLKQEQNAITTGIAVILMIILQLIINFT